MDCGLCLLDLYTSNNSISIFFLYRSSQSWPEEKIKDQLNLSNASQHVQLSHLWKIVPWLWECESTTLACIILRNFY